MRASLLFLLSAVALGQAPAPLPTPAPTAPQYPQYYIGLGGAYDRYSTTSPRTAGWLTQAVSVGSGTYSFTTLDLGRTSTSIRTGFAKVMASSNGSYLMAIVDAGVTTGSVVGATPSATLGTFGGGMVIVYDLGNMFKQMKGQGLSVVGIERMVTVSSAGVKPVFEIGVGKTF